LRTYTTSIEVSARSGTGAGNPIRLRTTNINLWDGTHPSLGCCCGGRWWNRRSNINDTGNSDCSGAFLGNYPSHRDGTESKKSKELHCGGIESIFDKELSEGPWGL